MHSRLHLHVRMWILSHRASMLRCLRPERIFRLLIAKKYYLEIFHNFIIAVQWSLVPCSICGHMNMMFPLNRGRVTARELPLHNVVGRPCM